MNPFRTSAWSLRLLAAPLIACVTLMAGEGRQPLTVGLQGFPTSTMDEKGRLIEDWGVLRLMVRGTGLPTEVKTTVQETRLEGSVPALLARSEYGSITLTQTVFRAPAWPAGVDVLTARVQEVAGRQTKVTLTLELPKGARVGENTVTLGSRIIIALPKSPAPTRTEREWGHTGDASPLPGWAKPATPCDPAFRNILAGMGGVPIVYRFAVPKKSEAQVVLGFCESHWAETGQRLLLCKVEGAEPQTVDPIARWGRHKPGVLLFKARDLNEDERLDVCVLPQTGAKDRNPILNVIWVFQADLKLNLDKVMAGLMNSAALRYVDVGGPSDQTLYESDQLQYARNLPPGGTEELTFLVACPGASAPNPNQTAWTPQRLLSAAKEVLGALR